MQAMPSSGAAAREIPATKMGVLLLIVSESVFFLLLILAFVFYRAAPANADGPTAFNSLDVPKTAFFSVCLYASSLTIWLADRSVKRGHDLRLKAWLLATIVLGGIFLYGQASEYYKLIGEQGVTPGRNLFGSTFFTLTGFHGLHVLVGLCLLLTLFALALRGTFKGGRGASGFETVSWYWHFVDGVWVVIFPVVYLWSLVGH